MSESSVLHQRISSVMDILASAAVTEICKLVEDCCGALNVEVFQSKEQIKMLEKQLSLTESRYRSVSGIEGQTFVTCGSSSTNSPSGNSPAAEDEGGLSICNCLQGCQIIQRVCIILNPDWLKPHSGRCLFKQ